MIPEIQSLWTSVMQDIVLKRNQLNNSYSYERFTLFYMLHTMTDN